MFKWFSYDLQLTKRGIAVLAFRSYITSPLGLQGDRKNTEVMKKILLLVLLATMSAITANAFDFTVDDLHYEINDDGKSVTLIHQSPSSSNYSNLSGVVYIQPTVTYNNIIFKVTRIGNSAFHDCTGMTSVDIPNTVTSIGLSAFLGCSNLTSVTIPSSVTSFDGTPFKNCPSLTSLVVENGNPKYDSRDNCNAIIVTATNMIFSGCRNTTIPNTVTKIGSYAFEGCSSMTSITIPNSITSIANDSFKDCTGLTSVTWNISDYKEGNQPFANLLNIKTFTFGDGVKVIPAGLCEELKGLTSVTIPNSVTSIGNGAFLRCSGLRSVTIGNSVTSIGNLSFYECSSLTSVSIPNSVTNIGFSAFGSCTSMSTLSIGTSVANIGDFCFNGCTGLTKVIWNAKSCEVAEAFHFLDNLKTIIFGDGVEMIPDYLCSDTGLTSVTIPNSVKVIGEHAFSYCINMTSAIIGNSVTTIGECAFTQCTGLTSVTIPNSVTSIGEYAFGYCEGFSSIKSEINNPSDDLNMGNGVFYGVDTENCILYVPKGTKGIYQNTPQWCDFLNIIDTQAVPGDVNGDNVVTATDITELYNYLLNGSTTYLSSSDITGDGEVTSADVTAVYNILLGN